jgi:hypothetical protein
VSEVAGGVVRDRQFERVRRSRSGRREQLGYVSYAAAESGRTRSPVRVVSKEGPIFLEHSAAASGVAGYELGAAGFEGSDVAAR